MLRTLSDERQRAQLLGRVDSFPSHMFSMNPTHAFMMYECVKKKRRHVSVDFFVTCMSEEFFKPKASDSKKALELAAVIPKFFPGKPRLMMANAEAGFAGNTHKATAFEDASEVIDEEFGSKDDDDAKTLGKPQCVKLPFVVEPNIVHWEVQMFPSDDAKFATQLGNKPFYAVLTVEMAHIKKPKQRNRGSIRVFTTTPDVHDSDNGSEDGEASMVTSSN